MSDLSDLGIPRFAIAEFCTNTVFVISIFGFDLIYGGIDSFTLDSCGIFRQFFEPIFEKIIHFLATAAESGKYFSDSRSSDNLPEFLVNVLAKLPNAGIPSGIEIGIYISRIGFFYIVDTGMFVISCRENYIPESEIISGHYPCRI
ncbi:hypothetical protein K060079A122_02450 [Alistipes onderdonkii]